MPPELVSGLLAAGLAMAHVLVFVVLSPPVRYGALMSKLRIDFKLVIYVIVALLVVGVVLAHVLVGLRPPH